MIYLSRYTVNEEVFEKILNKYKRKIVITNNFENYVHGYRDKEKIVCNGDDLLIITILSLRTIVDKQIDERSWLQVIVQSNEGQKEAINKDISGLTAYNKLDKFLQKWYNENEIQEILSKEWMESKELKPQMHFVHYTKGKIEKHENCYKYDINGAHAYVLSMMFPKARDGFRQMYQERKNNPEIKKIFNYSVGWLKHIGHSQAYDYIRTTVSEIMEEQIGSLGGEILYINTDGFIVKNPLYTLDSSTNLGDFKEEYSGTVYMYSGENYFVYQTANEIKGSAMNCIRKMIDLPNGKVVSYKKEFDESGFFIASDIKEVQL